MANIQFRDRRIAELEARCEALVTQLEQVQSDYGQADADLDEARAEVERLRLDSGAADIALSAYVAENKRLRERITAVMVAVESEPLPVGEPKESINIGRLQVADEIRAALAEQETPE